MIKMMDGLFDKENLNSGRQIDMDIARGFAVLFMILVHVLETFGSENLYYNAYGVIIEFLGSPPAAPVFMFLLGVGVVYSKNAAPKKMLVKGIGLLVLGYLLSAVRNYIPCQIGLMAGTVTAEDFWWDPINYLLEIDILQFAGISMMFLAFLRKINLKYTYYPIVACAISIASPFLWGKEVGNSIIDTLLVPIWGTQEYVWFPFFSWAFYPLCGVFFGSLLIRAVNKKLFYKRVAVIMVPITVLGVIISYFDTEMFLGDYYRHGIGNSLVILAIVVYWIIFLNAVKDFIPSIIKKRLLFWSKNVTVVYCLQWIVLGWSSIFSGWPVFGYIGTTLLMVIITVLTDRLTVGYLFLRKKSGQKEIPVNIVN